MTAAETFLLVDDNTLLRASLAKLIGLWRQDVVIAEAADGRQALEMARRLRPTIILMDIRMPGVNGLEATRLIKTEMPEIKIVMLTVSDRDQDLFEAIKSGAEGYLLKSLQGEQFVELLKGVERGEAPMSPGLAAKILSEFAQRTRHESKPEATTTTDEILTDREKEVLHLMVNGLSNREIAGSLTISENTVKFHLKNILAKLHARNRTEAVAYALRTGLVRVTGSGNS